MPENNTAALQSLIQFALPIGTSLVTGSPETEITWAITVRAQPPAFPDIYGGELALVSMELLRSYDSRLTLAGVIDSLAEVGVEAIALLDDIPDAAMDVATARHVSLLALPEGSSLTTVERAVNKLILNRAAQLTERAIEIQRQLTRLAAENRDLNSLLHVISRATAKPVVVHDESGILLAQVMPNVTRRGASIARSPQALPFGAFQNWLERLSPDVDSSIVQSPIGYTTVLKVEKRVAGFLSLAETGDRLDDFDRLVLTYGADVCAIELAKTRAIASAVEQARGDWVQMWLSGTTTDADLIATRAQQAGFDPLAPYVVVTFRAASETGMGHQFESLLSLLRDDMGRRQIDGTIGQYVDTLVALYSLNGQVQLSRVRQIVEELRLQLAARVPGGLVSAGISHPASGLSALREAHREAKDAMNIAAELGNEITTTYYGDLKLYQFLLAMKERSLETMQVFYEETLGPLVEHDERKQGDLIRTLSGFFEANGNLAKAAQDLDVHRNTLVYRLERISELTQMNLDDSDNRLILHLALKIQRVLATVAEY